MTTSAIEIKNIIKDYPGVRALDSINFNVKKGSIHGFLGPNGAGKSTAMRIITGLIPASSGEVFVAGLSVQKNVRETKSLIGFLPEHPPLYGNMRVGDYLEFVKDLHSLHHPERKADRGLILEKCGLADVEKRLIGNLSKGYRQRVGIAQTLIYNPEIVVLDEPTVGLDPVAIAEIRDLILKLKKDHTILLSTHQLHEAELICDEITIINRGKILRSGSIAGILQDFQGGQYVTLKLQKWNEDSRQELTKRFGASNITVEANANEVVVRMLVSGAKDYRAELSSFAVEKGYGLLSIMEEKLELEELFKQVTGESNVGSEVRH